MNENNISLDVLLNIAKYCNSKIIRLFAMTCRYFSSKKVWVDDKDINKSFKIMRNELWRLAKEAQFPHSKYLWFLGDAENYYMAKADKMIICLDHYNDRCGGIYEYDYKLIKFRDYFMGFHENDASIHFYETYIENRYCLFIFNEQYDSIIYHSSLKELLLYVKNAKKTQKWYAINIIDLAQMNICFNGVKKHTKNKNKNIKFLLKYESYGEEYDLLEKLLH